MSLSRANISIAPAYITLGGTNIGYTEVPFDWFPEEQLEPLFVEQLGLEPFDYIHLGFASFGTTTLMQYDGDAMAAAYGGFQSAGTVTVPGATVKAGMRATEIAGKTGQIVVTPIKTGTMRPKLTIYNGVLAVPKGAAQRWGSRATLGTPIIILAIRDGSDQIFKEEPSA